MQGSGLALQCSKRAHVEEASAVGTLHTAYWLTFHKKLKIINL